MKKVCIITAARSEYSHLKNVISAIKASEKLECQLVVTGSHLSPEYGKTENEIDADGFPIDKRVDMIISSTSAVATAKSMGLCSISIADAFHDLSPDIIVVLGDRYELLPICSTALVMRIPIAHISGGYITTGAIDNEVRNAVSMLADIHFPGTEEAGQRLLSMGIPMERVHVVGTLSTENSLKVSKMTRNELAKELNLDIQKKWVMFTYHPETKITLEENITILKSLIDGILKEDNIQIIASYGNADNGGVELNRLLELYSQNNPDLIKVYKNLGNVRYINVLRNAVAMMGNSSSGIYESQLWDLDVLNVGNRQNGRSTTSNILTCPGVPEKIKQSVTNILSGNFKKNRNAAENIYGDGRTSEYIVKHLIKYLYEL